MKYSNILLFFIIFWFSSSFETSAEIQSSGLLNDNCQFTHNLTSETFEYRCEKGSFDEHCKLPDDVIQPNFDTVKHLKITDCPLNTVKNSYRKYGNLQSLDLSNSGYDSIISLEHEHLVKVNLSHYRLSGIPRNFFEKIPKLREIDLSNNELQALRATFFENALKLTKIDLSLNTISFIDSNAFSHLMNLQSVDLSYNILSKIDYIFDRNTNLSELHLNRNMFRTFDCSIFSITGCIMYVSWDEVEILDTNCARGQISIELNSQMDAISSKSSTSIEWHFKNQGFNAVKDFSAGKNQVKNLTELISMFSSSLETLRLSNNNVTKLEINTFEKFINLKKLELSNTNLSEFNFSILEKLEKLYWLDISDNEMKNVQNISALMKIKLKYFFMRNNRLENTLEIIGNLSAWLDMLDVSGNFIGQLKPNTFDTFSNLYSLILSNTSLSTFDFNPFNFNPFDYLHLHTFDISYNNLENQNFEILSSTIKFVRSLNVTNCHIKNVNNLMKSLGTSIQIWDLSGNFIDNIDTNMFERFVNLAELHLANTNLTYFDFNAIANQRDSLKFLDISNNKLKEMHFPDWSNTINGLYLNGNDLIELHNFHRSNFPQQWKKPFKIGQNRFSCEYLAELKREWTDLIGNDSLQQKYGKCDISIQSMMVKYSYWIVGISIVGVVVIGISSVCFISRNRLFQKCIRKNSISRTTVKTEETEREIMHARDQTESPSNDNRSENIYEEINPLPIVYDRLRFDWADPSPVPAKNDHYDHIHTRRHS